MTAGVSTARRLWDVCEPVAASVYFLPECRERYRAMGLNGREGYYWSRGAALGTPSPAVVAATFAVFNPDVVRASVASAMQKVSREAILEARREGAGEGLRRILAGVDPEPAATVLRPVAEAGELQGRPLYAGLRELDWPADPHQALFRACDLVREYRADGHVGAWTSLGWHPVEVMALTEAYWGLPLGLHMASRNWPEDVVRSRVGRLHERGYLDRDDALTGAGLAVRRELEQRTDAAASAMVVAAERAGVDALVDVMRPLTRRVLDAGMYPVDPQLQHGPPPERPSVGARG